MVDITRTETFQGIETQFPEELIPGIRELVRRIENELDQLVLISQDLEERKQDA